jgi:hypothetical protein
MFLSCSFAILLLFLHLIKERMPMLGLLVCASSPSTWKVEKRGTRVRD